MTDPAPTLTTLRAPSSPRAAVLVAHGGRSSDTRASHRLQPTSLRMFPLTVRLARHGRDARFAAYQLGYRLVGYNDGDPVADVRWALDEIARRHGEVPVCLVGHSMGGRACLRAAGHPAVAGAVGLAAWLPPGEPVEQLAGRDVVLVHGTRDRITDPGRSLLYALAAHPVARRLCRFEIAGSGHAMLERARLWHALAEAAVLGMLGIGPLDPHLAAGFAAPADAAARIEL